MLFLGWFSFLIPKAADQTLSVNHQCTNNPLSRWLKKVQLFAGSCSVGNGLVFNIALTIAIISCQNHSLNDKEGITQVSSGPKKSSSTTGDCLFKCGVE